MASEIKSCCFYMISNILKFPSSDFFGFRSETISEMYSESRKTCILNIPQSKHMTFLKYHSSLVSLWFRVKLTWKRIYRPRNPHRRRNSEFWSRNIFRDHRVRRTLVIRRCPVPISNSSFANLSVVSGSPLSYFRSLATANAFMTAYRHTPIVH